MLSAQGVTGVRGRVLGDIRTFRNSAEWLEAIQQWIQFGGWADTADLLIDAAEIGPDDVRRTSAAVLAARPTPLLATNGYGPRIVRLHARETDAIARADWTDLRRRLGI